MIFSGEAEMVRARTTEGELGSAAWAHSAARPTGRPR
ncbi:hypothetical protein [Fodinicola feengrottensis]